MINPSTFPGQGQFVLRMTVGGDTIPMGLNHTGELLVRMQALPFEAVFPTSEKGASAAFGAVIPELPEGLLQNIGGVQAPVGLEQLFECAATV